MLTSGVALVTLLPDPIIFCFFFLSFTTVSLFQLNRCISLFLIQARSRTKYQFNGSAELFSEKAAALCWFSHSTPLTFMIFLFGLPPSTPISTTHSSLVMRSLFFLICLWLTHFLFHLSIDITPFLSLVTSITKDCLKQECMSQLKLVCLTLNLHVQLLGRYFQTHKTQLVKIKLVFQCSVSPFSSKLEQKSHQCASSCSYPFSKCYMLIQS